MDDLPALLARDFGVRPQGCGAPMSSSAPRSRPPPPASDPFAGVDIFAGVPGVKSRSSLSPSAGDFDSDFSGPSGTSVSDQAAEPVDTKRRGENFGISDDFFGFDSRVAAKKDAEHVDDDLFNMSGKKPAAAGIGSPPLLFADGDSFGVFREEVPASAENMVNGTVPAAQLYGRGLLGGFRKKDVTPPGVAESTDDDLLQGFEKTKEEPRTEERGPSELDELIHRFSAGGGSLQQENRNGAEMPWNSFKPTTSTIASDTADDPFIILESTTRPENSSSGSNSQSVGDASRATRTNAGSNASDGSSLLDPQFTKISDSFKYDMNADKSVDENKGVASASQEIPVVKTFENHMPEMHSREFKDGISTKSPETYVRSAMDDQSPRSTESDDDVWLLVSEIPLFTRPTSAPPPLRPPPPLTSKQTTVGANPRKDNQYIRQPSQNYSFGTDSPKKYGSYQTEEAESSAAAASAAAMKNAMNYAEAAFRYAKEVREREKDIKHPRTQGINNVGLDRGHEKLRERREKEEDRGHRMEQERRQRVPRASETAIREAQDRFAAQAQEKAERDGRQQEERLVVKRAQAEVRERLAAEAAKRAAAQVKGSATLKTKAGRPNGIMSAAVAGENQQTQEELGSFFHNPSFHTQAQQDTRSGDTQEASSSGSTMKKAQSATSITDDLSGELLFGEQENEERRRARLERDQRTRERAAKALAEKYERDLQQQREQEERHRIAETLDFQIKRWSAGKEGNLLALLSTLHNILWPECGWQPASLADLMTASAVKKQYHKAALCIHPDKMQQKGASLQQKYVAEKVFDLLKDAWNKFKA